jgi:hypothetical protein
LRAIAICILILFNLSLLLAVGLLFQDKKLLSDDNRRLTERQPADQQPCTADRPEYTDTERQEIIEKRWRLIEASMSVGKDFDTHMLAISSAAFAGSYAYFFHMDNPRNSWLIVLVWIVLAFSIGSMLFAILNNRKILEERIRELDAVFRGDCLIPSNFYEHHFVAVFDPLSPTSHSS